MGLKGQIVLMLVGFLVFKYLTHPPPDLSPELKAWKESGEFFDFKEFKIFFIGELKETIFFMIFLIINM